MSHTADELSASWAAFEARSALIEWRHTDGSLCPITMNDRLTTPEGISWWCTEHQQHLIGEPSDQCR